MVSSLYVQSSKIWTLVLQTPLKRQYLNCPLANELWRTPKGLWDKFQLSSGKPQRKPRSASALVCSKYWPPMMDLSLHFYHLETFINDVPRFFWPFLTYLPTLSYSITSLLGAIWDPPTYPNTRPASLKAPKGTFINDIPYTKGGSRHWRLFHLDVLG